MARLKKQRKEVRTINKSELERKQKVCSFLPSYFAVFFPSFLHIYLMVLLIHQGRGLVVCREPQSRAIATNATVPERKFVCSI